MATTPHPQDSAWKDIIRDYLPDFLTWYFPSVAAALDLSARPVFRDKELNRISRGNRLPGRVADLLIELPPSGAATSRAIHPPPTLILCHVEIQGSPESTFAERLFQYAYRIYDRFGHFPVTLVVLADSNTRFRPAEFTRDLLGATLRLEFHTAKLIDYRERVRVPGEDENIFATVTRIHLAVQQEKLQRKWTDDRSRYELKRRLMREVVEERADRPEEQKKLLGLLAFLDWLVALPKELDQLFFDETETARGAQTMPYVTSWERMGIEKGLEQGIEQGLARGELRDKHAVLKRLLDRKFGLEPEDAELIEGVTDPNRLDAALDAIIDATQREEVLGLLKD
jgi:predicted transposase/invertase (TIGR01784 family)